MECMVIYGNPVDGFSFIGPFQSAEFANAYADAAHSNSEWWVAYIYSPDPMIVRQMDDDN